MTDRRPVIAFGYRPDLLEGPLSDWLNHFRWISALMVAASHLRNELLPDAGAVAGRLNLPEQVFYFFTLFATPAVVVFFVISGLLIGGAVLRGLEQGNFSPPRYAIDRASRLYVGLVPAVALTVTLQWTLGSSACEAPSSVADVAANLAFLQNFGPAPLCNNDSLWSLSTEAYCYLAGAALIVAACRRTLWPLLIAAALMLPALLVFEGQYKTPLFGLGLWLCGLLPWFVRVHIKAWCAALGLIAALLVGRLHLLPNEASSEILVAAAFALLLCSDWQLLAAPARRMSVLFAGFSYSLYLVQKPLVHVFGDLFGHQQLPVGAARSYAIYSLALAAIILCGWLFGRLFEANTGRVRHYLYQAFGANRR